jgi:hypothetical protein
MRTIAFASKSFPPFSDDKTIFFPARQEPGLAEVHLLTGENGTGKTRLLCALAAAYGNPSDLNQRLEPLSGHNLIVLLEDGSNPGVVYSRQDERQELYSGIDLIKASASLREGFCELKTILQAPLKARGLNSLSQVLKTPFSAQCYRGTARIAYQKIDGMKAVKVGDAQTHLTFDRNANDDDLIVCQSMANLKMGAAMEFQGGMAVHEGRASKIVKRFEQAIAEVTGRTFTFLLRPQPELHLVAKWGDTTMNLNALPDGLRSIIAWLVACVSKLDAQFPDCPDPLDIPMVLLLDEPESHLHPAWQRKLLPAAQRLFPNAQIIAATHSPFIISSVNSGWIHILKFGEDGLVRAQEPIACSKGDTYIDAVEDVLGIREWYDPETESLLANFRASRKEVVTTKKGLDSLKKLAGEIGSRSESLDSIMAREMAQVYRQLGVAEATN